MRRRYVVRVELPSLGAFGRFLDRTSGPYRSRREARAKAAEIRERDPEVTTIILRVIEVNRGTGAWPPRPGTPHPVMWRDGKATPLAGEA